MICVFLADGFEPMEAVVAVDILRRAECDVKTIGIGKKEIESANGIKILAELEDKDINISDIDAIILPGGMPGAVNLQNSSFLTSAILSCNKEKKIIAAICAAPIVLGRLGILQGKKATCFRGFEGSLEGASISSNDVCIDGNIITANGPLVALDFAFTIVECICGVEKVNFVKGMMK